MLGHRITGPLAQVCNPLLKARSALNSAPAVQGFVRMGVKVSEDGGATAFLGRKPAPVLEHPSGKNAFPVFGQNLPS